MLFRSSAISSDSFDEAIQVDSEGNPILTKEMQERGIRLRTYVDASMYYAGFNMLDPIVGGNSVQAKKLRQAIAIGLDFDEYISIFLNGRGLAAQGPIPPGIFGYHEGESGNNPQVNDWKNGRRMRKSLTSARKLLAEAGYPDGIDPKTKQPLVLHFDITAGSGPEEQAYFRWLRKQFNKLGIELVIRATHYNRFQEKIRTGNVQLFMMGWLADYPDPENFLFLYYGPNSKVHHGGENQTNYSNPKFDKLFDQMKSLPNGPSRQTLINKMVALLQDDVPTIFGYHRKVFELAHAWYQSPHVGQIINNDLKYRSINAEIREKHRHGWNQPVLWPFWILLGLFVAVVVGVLLRVRQIKQAKPICYPRSKRS